MINFEELQETIVPNFKGGEGNTIIRKYEDAAMKVLRVVLKPGCSIGLHTHVTNSEVVYIIAGQGVCILNGKEEVLSRGYSFGCFRIRFDSRHPWMRCCSFCSNLRVRLRKIAFGDQGIFLTRELFEQIGGFADLPIMEDYKLSIDLKGKYPLGQTRGYLVTSARRFEQGGMLRTMWKMQVLQYRFRKGIPAEEIARQYRDIR